MPPKSKKPSILSRFVSLVGGRSNKPTKPTVDHHQGSAKVASTGAGLSVSERPLARSVADLSPPVDNTTSESQGSQPPIHQSGSENEIVDSSQGAAVSKHARQDVPHPPQPLESSEALQAYKNPPGPRGQGGGTSFLAGASGFRMRDIQYIESPHVTVHTGVASNRSIDGWELLLKHTAPNALHDSDARYDPPKCDEDTRVEVIAEITDWIHDRGGPQRLLCMTGAAGSGKSALQQTTAEISLKNGTLGSTFFFSASDPSRNTVKHIIPTIAYQLGRTNDTLRWWIKAAVEGDPLVFSKSLRTQMATLIVEPSQRCEGTGMDLTTLPYVILIDGLDECTGEDRQAELLTAVKEGLLVNGLPFRIFIASRPEWAIRTALEPGGHLRKVAYHIQLSNNYDASSDMRRYLQRRFEDIGLRIGDSHWFTEDNIETLVETASGQFVYVATVFKYISERRASPAGRLKIVLDWTPHEGQKARPFESLDRLYANILLAAKNAYEAVDTHSGHDFLLLFNAHHLNAFGIPTSSDARLSFSADCFSVILGLEAGAEENLVIDLRSLVTLEMEDHHLHLQCCLQHIVECPLDFDSLPTNWEELPIPKPQRNYLGVAVVVLPFALNGATADEVGLGDFTNKAGWSKLDKLMPLYTDLKVANTYMDWITDIGYFNDKLKSLNPEIGAVITEFIGKLKRTFERWDLMNPEAAELQVGGTDRRSVLGSGYSSEDIELEAS
ncbi:hypothetical protein EST38_g13576 [Candolleomyces aberdarensis]|uniref:Nephrocystin 3-like N-terminal domain-containing protein n=1 Tax=Candolleomyces aberdarensis TaxID=2316362 RepID=A0A4V1Q1P2_9AGAR|nr:hypothetical protein EST38_g13576 [Candolleomyces aberdarensis]